MNIVGLSAFYHDSSCCILRDGALVAAAEQERFSRRKHDSGLPDTALVYCLGEAGLTLADIDCIAYYENPKKKVQRQLWTALQPRVEARYRRELVRGLDVGRVEREIRDGLGFDGPIEYFDHHASHAASSFYYSGFRDAAIMTVDGVGEWATTTYGQGEGATIDLFEEVRFPDSLGLLYSAVTSFLGFMVNNDEYKVMGLAPYGRPRFVDALRSLVREEGAGQYALDMEYFAYLRDGSMCSERFVDLFGIPFREPESEIRDVHQDIAKSLQVVLEDILLAKARYLFEKTGRENLCMAGGVALNCVANGRILRDGPFSRLFVQPAASDAGAALGAAALAHVRLTGRRPTDEPLKHVYLGPSYSNSEVAKWVAAGGAESFAGDEDRLMDAVVDRLADGKVVAWFQGRMEFGPRALGARSILADPRVPDMRDRINALVKKREGFRPFAPAVLAEKAGDHFAIDHPSPFMLETCAVRSPLALPSITHVDGSARVQTVAADIGGRFYRLLKRFDERTGCPVLINTSFNVRGSPMVCSPFDAILTFFCSKLDALVIEDFVLDRDSLPPFWRALAAEREKTRRPLNDHAMAVSGAAYTFI